MIGPNDCVVWMNDPADLAAWTIDLVYLAIWMIEPFYLPSDDSKGPSYLRSRPVPAGGRSFLRIVVSAAGYLSAISFLIARPVFPLWRALVVVVRSWWPLLDSMPQLLILMSRLPSEVLDAGCNNLHLSFDWGHGRINIGSVIVGSFHNCD